ncbi:MAG TPA: DUF1566 domain-containing protein [Nitrosomonas sp.]|nr:DUF1566 domain-containing protein [Nitrosomonas sp.]HMW20837.1 DUF1566 domain-containing protein [Nitrosomonas sp.]HMW68540.1 DUF1566 domain-containing protein [Nitrosomonas sp.]HMY60768.1 DUF1566 domain-containing protein [Nitrosomonas sp.]HMY89295.1 DUF1566 domain-containing protein [Nitrosomonas sp.]
MATQAELDAAVAAQATVDAGQNTTINTQQSTIETLQNEITSLNNVNTAQQSALEKAQADIADLKVLIEKYHPEPKKIGDHFGGGIVFYIDPTGQHGLITSLFDLSDKYIPWFNGINKITGATGDGIGVGAPNTALIVAAQTGDGGPDFYAAKLAADFSVQEDGVKPCTGEVGETCYRDWYLPSKFELNLLYQQKTVVGNFMPNEYWSSTEYDANNAWLLNFTDGTQYFTDKYFTVRVRAVRAF